LSDSVHAHHVVIVGAGFGGLEVARRLAGAPVRITIIDQCNYHLFQPLLYQVATASLATSEIAWPVRHLLRKRKEVTTLLAVVSGIHIGDGKVLLEDGGVVTAPKLGLWLARFALRLTGNREHANASRLLPLIPWASAIAGLSLRPG
jgi:NADH dehydrogenase